MTANDQLTDGGPSVTLELLIGGVGPPFGVAVGWVVSARNPAQHNKVPGKTNTPANE